MSRHKFQVGSTYITILWFYNKSAYLKAAHMVQKMRVHNAVATNDHVKIRILHIIHTHTTVAGNDGAIFQITRLNITHKISGYHGQLLNKCSLYNTYIFSLKSLHLKTSTFTLDIKKIQVVVLAAEIVLLGTPLRVVQLYC